MTIVNARSQYMPSLDGTPGEKIATSSNVLGSTWQAAAEIVNALHARGGQLVLANQVNESIADGATSTLRWYAWPRLAARHRVWVVYASGTSSTRVTLTLDGGTETPATYSVDVTSSASGVNWQAVDNPPPAVLHVSTITPTNTPGEITLAITATGAAAFVYSVACFDMPRTRLLLGGTDDVAAYAGPGFAIYEELQSGLYGIAQAVEAGHTKLRRKLFDWHNSTGFTTTSTSYTAVFQLAPKVLGRHGSTATGTTVDVTVAARLSVTGAATGELRVTAASGDTVTLSTTSTTPVWVTGTLSIDREDLGDTDSGGQPSRLYGDALTFELRRTGGTSASVTGLGVGEPT